MRRYLLTLAVLATIPAPGGGFQIAPLDAVHERLAWMSEQCLASGVVPAGGRMRCPFDDATIAASIPAVSTKPKDQKGIEAAVRWGDDPGRATATMSTGQTVKYLFQLSQTCDDQVGKKGVFATIYRAGLMCSGHYGRLGFFHAMMSVDDAALIAAAPSDPAVNARMQLVTRDKILAWTDFTYRVATGAVAPDASLCTTVSKDSMLAPVFDDGAKCRDADAAWTVRRFFTFKCTNPRLEKPCDTAPESDDAAVRLAALGALLHTIQDSYAQGHVRRLDPPARDYRKNKLLPVIACEPPKQYFYYDKANREDGHGSADSEPSVRMCGPAAVVDDPVSAGAMALWMARGNKPAKLFRAYLTARVFPLPR
ncbi:MAG: hypothetical protein E7773_10030 [Sphingomonas sp.]|uniref:hypothetical protein n=1 Tax=Sphingomonas sp. TaxID=28214 RepID=UPI00121F5228|nr:hypothetical protein [Sphingomonas sp.]THD36244.1 MAG: hypothetical protein E7773_10030 [Sphingomonas sp.]